MSEELETLKRDYPWPDVSGIKGEYFSLDGGGRELIIEQIEKNSVNFMLEIGVYMGGSVITWLDAFPDLHILGLDPWDDTMLAGEMRRYFETPIIKPSFSKIDDPAAFVESYETHGPYLQACANLKPYSDRFTPLREPSPQFLYELKDRGIHPELVYVDSVKERADLDVVHSLWPETILCGDDWSWNAAENYPMRQAVEGFARDNNFSVNAHKATWVVEK